MAQRQTVFLMYHELEIPGRPLCQTEPGYVRYVLHASEFQSQMQLIKSQGWRGVCVKEALRYQPDTVAITFDDGSETDLICACLLYTSGPVEIHEIDFDHLYLLREPHVGVLGRELAACMARVSIPAGDARAIEDSLATRQPELSTERSL